MTTRSTLKSFACALAGWLAGVACICVRPGHLRDGLDLLPFTCAISAPVLFALWSLVLNPLYHLVPLHSPLWRPVFCVPAGAAVGALLFVLLFCCPFGLPWIFAWSGAGAGAATCALGSTIFRPLPAPNHGAAANGLWLGRWFCLPRPSWARGRR